MLAVLFMEGAHGGFKTLLHDLEKDYALGAELYPDNMQEALQVLTEYTEQPRYKHFMKDSDKKWKQSKSDEAIAAESYAQMSKNQMRRKGLCFKCGREWDRDHKCSESKWITQKEPEQQHVGVRFKTVTAKNWFSR